MSVYGEVVDCKKALEDFGCSKFLLVERGVFGARAVKLALHNVSLLRMKELLARIATFACAVGMRRFILSPIKGHMACNGVEVLPQSILMHGPDITVFERVSSNCESRVLLIPEDVLLRTFGAIVGMPLKLPGGVTLWQPETRSLSRLIALYSASTGMSMAGLDRAHGTDSYRGLEQEVLTAIVACLEGLKVQAKPHASDRRAEALRRVESVFCTTEDPSRATNETCQRLGISVSTLRRYCLEQFGLSALQYHKAVHEYDAS